MSGLGLRGVIVNVWDGFLLISVFLRCFFCVLMVRLGWDNVSVCLFFVCLVCLKKVILKKLN